MAIVAKPRIAGRLTAAAVWMPLAFLPILVTVLGSGWHRWLFMWSLAFSIYAGFKWLSFADSSEGQRASAARSAAYLLLWPGMDAKSFFESRRSVPVPRSNEWIFAVAKTAFGVGLLVVAVSITGRQPLVAAWVGLAGIAFVVHFGLFHVLSLAWRQGSVDARPLMDTPIKASSVADFWGHRWNTAFRDLVHAYVFRPLVGPCGTFGATLAVFIVSGLVHDLVISLPAGAGFGLPTAYFVLQGVALLFERSRLGKRLGLGSGPVGWLFAAAVTLAPVGLLFHRPFLERIIVPMLAALATI